jgi:hypothetical protein
MSRKVTIFKNIIPQPLTTHNFLITIPGTTSLQFIVESATYPAIKLGDVAIPFRGGKIYRPTQPEYDGVWRVLIPESELGTLTSEIWGIQSVIARSGSDAPARMKGFSMYFGDVTTAKKSKEGKYRSITVHVLNGLDIPVLGFKLHGAWLKGRDSVQLNGNDPTNAWKWPLEFRYTSVEEIGVDINLVDRVTGKLKVSITPTERANLSQLL